MVPKIWGVLGSQLNFIEITSGHLTNYFRLTEGDRESWGENTNKKTSYFMD